MDPKTLDISSVLTVFRTFQKQSNMATILMWLLHKSEHADVCNIYDWMNNIHVFDENNRVQYQPYFL